MASIGTRSRSGSAASQKTRTVYMPLAHPEQPSTPGVLRRGIFRHTCDSENRDVMFFAFAFTVDHDACAGAARIGRHEVTVINQEAPTVI
jgi:hypothetical protein